MRRRVTRPALGEGGRGSLRKKLAGRAIRWAAGGCVAVCAAQPSVSRALCGPETSAHL